MWLPAGERYRKIWKLYLIYKGEGRRVLRKGFNDYGVYNRDYPAFCPPDRPEYDIEHEAGCVFLAFLMFELFPEFFSDIDRAEVYELLMSHDLGEISSGDISDDGNRDELKKDTEEFDVLERIVGGISRGFDRLLVNFLSFQKKDSRVARLAYCIDKIEAVLQGLVYETYGFGGKASHKRAYFGLSSQDEKNIEITGSDDLVDIWLESIRPKLEKNDPTGTDFFYEFVRSAIHIAREDKLALLDEI